MPPKKQKEVPLTPEQERALNALVASPGASTEQWKALGNECFARGSHLTAIRCYTKAIETPGGATAVLYSNRSAAYLKSTMFSGPAMALKDAERAVELEPSWFKSHLRVADAQYARKKYEEAQRSYEKALTLDATCQAAKTSLHELKKEMFLRDLDKQEQERTRAQAAEGEDVYASTASGTGAPSTSSTLYGGEGAAPRRGGAAEFHNAPLDGSDRDPTGRTRPPTEDETARLIRTWGMDMCVREDRTAMRARTVDLAEADRTSGKSYKDNLLKTFRRKVETSDQLSSQIKERHEKDHLQGDGIDYRQGDRYRRQYARATNGIGLGISADAYKEFTGQDKIW